MSLQFLMSEEGRRISNRGYREHRDGVANNPWAPGTREYAAYEAGCTDYDIECDEVRWARD